MTQPSTEQMAAELEQWAAETEALCNAATAGDWLADWTIDPPDGPDLWFVGVEVDGEIETVVPAAGCTQHDCKFIAAARPLVPALVEIVKGAVERWREAVAGQMAARALGNGIQYARAKQELDTHADTLRHLYNSVIGGGGWLSAGRG